MVHLRLLNNKLSLYFVAIDYFMQLYKIVETDVGPVKVGDWCGKNVLVTAIILHSSSHSTLLIETILFCFITLSTFSISWC